MPELFRTEIESDADVKVFLTDIRGEADRGSFFTDVFSDECWQAEGKTGLL